MWQDCLELMECDFFVTDSFHGTCFALIMGKPFISIVNTARGASRFYSIGHKLNVMDRIVESFDDVKQRYVQLKEMDYTKVTNRIRDEVDFSKKWLLEQLNRKTLDNYLITRFKLSFGNRIMKQLYDFIPVYVACGGTELGGMDYIVARKVLKKFESMNVTFVRDEITGLITYIDKLFGKAEMQDLVACLLWKYQVLVK